MLVLGAAVSRENVDAAGKYWIKINKQQNVVTVYKNKDGKYKAHKAFVCSTGTATPLGNFPLGEKIRWHVLDGPSYGQYCSRITGSILFHSVWYYQPKKDTQSYIQYNRLGTTASHGCVRLTVADAKWIYDNCPSGTKVTIYNSANPGPLGKPKAIKVSGYMGWDPTDPDPANPYKKKQASITGEKKQTIAYGAKFKILKGITALNSVGTNAKDLVTVTIRYKAVDGTKYKKVKEVNTKKAGTYKVLYKLKDQAGSKAKLTVTYKVQSLVKVKAITLKNTSKKLYLGGKASAAKFTLKVKKITPAKATIQKVSYLSSDKKVATVTKKGVVKAKKPGSALITVKAGDGSNVTAACKVTVIQRAKTLKLTAAGDSLEVGNSMQLRASFTPSNVSSKALTYTSSDEAVATVSTSGSVKALKSGKVTITAATKDGSNITAKYVITTYYKYQKTATEAIEVSVLPGTAWETVMQSVLPASIVIEDAYGNQGAAGVSWSCAAYDPNIQGTYAAVGIVTTPDGWSGTIPSVTAKINVNETKTATGSAAGVSGAAAGAVNQ